MKRIAMTVAVVALLAAACGSGDIVATSPPPSPASGPDTAQQLAALAEARQLWEAGPADYTVTVGGKTLAVRSGEVVSLGSVEAATVDDVYATIEDSIRTGAVVEVEYNAELGYPTRVVIDLDGDGTADIELTYSDLVAMPVVTTLEQLLEARALWESQGFDTYRYIFRVECTCEEAGTFDVEVRDGRVFTFLPLDDAAETSQLTPTSIERAFDDLEEWFTDAGDFIEQGLLSVDVRMDPELGYPRWFDIEADSIDDDEFSGRFTLVATIDLVLPYEPIEEPNGGVSGADKRALEVARALWEAAAVDDYRYKLTLHCECPLTTSGPFEVTVRGGEVWSVVGPSASGPLPDVVLIEEFFDVIEVTIDAGTDVDVTYDDVLGHPVLAIIDTEAVAVDGGLAFSISEFEVIDELGFLSGRVLAGPQCPVQQNPPEPGCEDQPVSGVELLITGANLGDIAVPLTTDTDGGFYVALEPGDYTITAPNLPEYLGTPEPVTVTIRAASDEEITLLYDTGIR